MISIRRGVSGLPRGIRFGCGAHKNPNGMQTISPSISHRLRGPFFVLMVKSEKRFQSARFLLLLALSWLVFARNRGRQAFSFEIAKLTLEWPERRRWWQSYETPYQQALWSAAQFDREIYSEHKLRKIIANTHQQHIPLTRSQLVGCGEKVLISRGWACCP